MILRSHASGRGFTLFEMIVAIAILALISMALFSASSAALEASQAQIEDQAGAERTNAFVRATRKAFLSLPGNARMGFQFDNATGGAAVPEIVFSGAGTYFGIPAAGGKVVISAPAQSDGTRTFGILRFPKGLIDRNREPGQWFPLLSRVEKIEWAFLVGEEWRTEWNIDGPRATLVRLRFTPADDPDAPEEHFFWIPPASQPQSAPEPTPEEANPSPSPEP